jgi:hypothetical protein
VKLYAIYDQAMQMYLQPFPAHSNAHAIRSFSDHANEAGTPVNKHPEDYSLDYIADFDEQTGNMTGNPVRIAKATDHVINKTDSRALDISEAIARKRNKETA